MQSLTNNRTVMVEAWAQVLRRSSWNVEANTHGWKRPNPIGNIVPDIRAFSRRNQLIGLVASEQDLKDFEKLVHNIISLKLIERNERTKIHLLVPQGLVRYIYKELQTFPDAEILLDHVWEFFS